MSTTSDMVNALERVIAAHRHLAAQIDAANPGDPYASLMVVEDADTLEELQQRLNGTEEPPPNPAQLRFHARLASGWMYREDTGEWIAPHAWDCSCAACVDSIPF